MKHYGNKKRDDKKGAIGPDQENDNKVFAIAAVHRCLYPPACRYLQLLAGISVFLRAGCPDDFRSVVFPEKRSHVP